MIRDRLKVLRKQTGMSIRVMAEAIGMKTSSYQHYEDRFKGEYLPLDVFLPVRDALICGGVSVHDAESLSEFPATQLTLARRGEIRAPLISWVQAGQPKEQLGAVMSASDSFVPLPYHRDSVFCLTVEGNSMSRQAPETSIIAVDYEDTDLVDGKMYVCKTGEGETTFKRFKANPHRLEPDSLEGGHDTLFGYFEVIGRVVFISRPV